jgi:tellurium resistance protein TerD
MAVLELNLTKPEDVVQMLALNLEKGERFRARLVWDGGADLDLHAFVAVNTGSGGKISNFGDILSTYNVKREIRGKVVGTLDKKADGTFEIHGGALVHSPDALDGASAEWVVVEPDRLVPPEGGAIEIPLVAMIHPQSSGRAFRDVKNARVIVENSEGVEVLNASLSDQFGDFVGVQMGAIMVEPNGSSFANIGVGFNDNFNKVLQHYA